MLTSWLMATDPGGPAGDGRRAGGKSNLTAARQWNSKMAFFGWNVCGAGAKSHAANLRFLFVWKHTHTHTPSVTCVWRLDGHRMHGTQLLAYTWARIQSTEQPAATGPRCGIRSRCVSAFWFLIFLFYRNPTSRMLYRWNPTMAPLE